MGFITINPNPKRKSVGDCVIRAICVATDKEWDEVFLELMLKAFDMKDMPMANNVWGSYLTDLGFTREIIPNTCPECCTVKYFLVNYPQGAFVVGTGTHAVAVKDGQYYDTWDSGDEVPLYYFKKEE